MNADEYYSLEEEHIYRILTSPEVNRNIILTRGGTSTEKYRPAFICSSQ
jgi:hypothetical protein